MPFIPLILPPSRSYLIDKGQEGAPLLLSIGASLEPPGPGRNGKEILKSPSRTRKES